MAIDVTIAKNEALDLKGRMRIWAKLVKGTLLKDVAQLTVRQAKERIKSTQVSPDLRVWPPRKKEYPHPMLRKTGALLRSIGKKRQSADTYSSGVQSSFAAKVAAYAVYQQYGTKSKKTGKQLIEPRPFIGVGNVDIAEIRDLVSLFVELRF